MKLFESNFPTVITRYYVMMAVVLIAGFSGLWWLAILAFPILISALLSIKVFDREGTTRNETGKLVKMKGEHKSMKEAI